MISTGQSYSKISLVLRVQYIYIYMDLKYLSPRAPTVNLGTCTWSWVPVPVVRAQPPGTSTRPDTTMYRVHFAH
eukprot:SAG31_NODE_10523_length_1128_cov_2.301263_1_plen_74_part_00